jgi:hypothetical protein
MLFRALRSSGGLDAFGEHMRRARTEGSLRGKNEAKLFRLAVNRSADRAKVMDWLNTAVDEGHAELEAQHASAREIEARDMACRNAFLLEII